MYIQSKHNYIHILNVLLTKNLQIDLKRLYCNNLIIDISEEDIIFVSQGIN